MAAPLAGVRVVDFGRFIAGPYCAMLLADLGADCIRVERREGGEDRHVGPVGSDLGGGLYLNLNRNKRGMTLALGHPQSNEVVRRLVEWADIVVANLPLELLQRVGLDYPTLSSIKPSIIQVMASAFGPDGPYAHRVGFDTVAQAMCGAMSLTGFPGPPVRSLVPFCDFGTALHGAFGALAALVRRNATGAGSLVDVSLLATGVTFMQPFLAERATTGVERTQWGNTGFYAAPSDTYRTSDGWIMVPTLGDWMFRRWAALVGRPEMADDPRFATDIDRANHHDVVNEVMAAWCAARTSAEAAAELGAARLPCGPVSTLDDVLSDPQVLARGLLTHAVDDGGSKPVPLAATPLRLTDTPRPLPRHAPKLGEHTDTVLAELGFTGAEIAELRSAGAI
jgi:crotonobetainyl-CoA:carnitine CoA-transferase CaiB-like acyl-CoA transferase